MGWINTKHAAEQLIVYRAKHEQAPGDDDTNRVLTHDGLHWKDQYFLTMVYLYSGSS